MSRSSQILVVTFDPSTEIDPLTVIAKKLAESVEQYLQRVVSGPVDVSVADHEDRGQLPAASIHRGTAVKVINTPRLRGSVELRSRRRGVNPSVERADNREE